MLAGTSLVFTLLYALPAGIISALNRNKWIDYLLRAASFVGVSMPSFWLGLVLIYIFGLKLGLVPIASSRVTPIGVILPSRYISCCSRVQVHAPSSSRYS